LSHDRFIEMRLVWFGVSWVRLGRLGLVCLRCIELELQFVG
jgi:hypothetical protein